MARRRDNMLEAFRESAEATRERASRAAPPPGGAGGPFAPPREARSPAPADSGPPQLGPPPEPMPLLLPFGGIAFLLIQVLLLAGAFALGRITAAPAGAPGNGAVRAEDRVALQGPDEAPGELAVVPLDQAELAGRPPADLAWMDPENKVTIRAIQYGASKREGDLAFQAYEHLLDRGFQVVTPYFSARSKQMYLFVDAAPTKAELEPILERLRRTPGPGRDEDAFASAFIVNIADYR